MVYDSIIIGGGPAGISAGLTLRRRNKTAAIVSGPLADIPLYKSHCVDNYPGMPDLPPTLLNASAKIRRNRCIRFIRQEHRLIRC